MWPRLRLLECRSGGGRHPADVIGRALSLGRARWHDLPMSWWRTAGPQPASRGLRAQAKAIDAALYGAAVVLYVLPSWLRADPGKRLVVFSQALDNTRHPWQRPLRGGVSALGEQVPTPGQRMIGLRTVDARTGRRVELWRTLARACLKEGSAMLTRRLMRRDDPADLEASRRELKMELAALREKYGEDREGLNAAAARLWKDRSHEGRLPAVRVLRWLPVALGLGFLQRRADRALGPTIVIVARSRKARAAR
jgi:hypothetical protein